MFDRVSSDTLNYDGHAECPVSASRYTVVSAQRAWPTIRAPLRRSRHHPRILSKNRKRSTVESIGPSATTVMANVRW
jgi:hypothetical protein